MPAWDSETYRRRLLKYRSWLITYLMDERPKGDVRRSVSAQGAAQFEISMPTSDRYLAAASTGPDFVHYRHAGRNMIRYHPQEPVMDMISERGQEAAPIAAQPPIPAPDIGTPVGDGYDDIPDDPTA